MPASEARSAMLQHCLRDDRLRAKASSERAPPFAISKSGEPSTPCHQQLVQRYFVAICSERWTRPTRSSSSQSDGVVDTSIRTEQCATLRLFRAGGKGANECSPYTVSLRTSNSSFPCAGFFGSPYCHVECGVSCFEHVHGTPYYRVYPVQKRVYTLHSTLYSSHVRCGIR